MRFYPDGTVQSVHGPPHCSDCVAMVGAIAKAATEGGGGSGWIEVDGSIVQALRSTCRQWLGDDDEPDWVDLGV